MAHPQDESHGRRTQGYGGPAPWIQGLAITAIFGLATLDALVPGFDPDPLQGYGLLIAGVAIGAAVPILGRLLQR